MAKVKKSKKKIVKKEVKSDTLWRKPITLDSVEDEDPLATLYQGREVGDKNKTVEELPKKQKVDTAKSIANKIKTSTKPVISIKPKKSATKKRTENTSVVNEKKKNRKSKTNISPKVTEEELKNLLRIKSDSFQFTDIREILRGRSLDIYAYLRFLSGDAGVCKIKHNDLMKILDISRPTLFKQGDWLETLSLIKKSSVPGDHLGTSYTVSRLEDILPVSNTIVEQMKSHIETIGYDE